MRPLWGCRSSTMRRVLSRLLVPLHWHGSCRQCWRPIRGLWKPGQLHAIAAAAAQVRSVRFTRAGPVPCHSRACSLWKPRVAARPGHGKRQSVRSKPWGALFPTLEPTKSLGHPALCLPRPCSPMHKGQQLPPDTLPEHTTRGGGNGAESHGELDLLAAAAGELPSAVSLPNRAAAGLPRSRPLSELQAEAPGEWGWSCLGRGSCSWKLACASRNACILSLVFVFSSAV